MNGRLVLTELATAIQPFRICKGFTQHHSETRTHQLIIANLFFQHYEAILNKEIEIFRYKMISSIKD